MHNTTDATHGCGLTRAVSDGFFAKWAEGRIDDLSVGWKGRALWSTNSLRTVFHNEGGTQNHPRVVKFQLRPDPLAR